MRKPTRAEVESYLLVTAVCAFMGGFWTGVYGLMTWNLSLFIGGAIGGAVVPATLELLDQTINSAGKGK